MWQILNSTSLQTAELQALVGGYRVPPFTLVTLDIPGDNNLVKLTRH